MPTHAITILRPICNTKEKGNNFIYHQTNPIVIMWGLFYFLISHIPDLGTLGWMHIIAFVKMYNVCVLNG